MAELKTRLRDSGEAQGKGGKRWRGREGQKAPYLKDLRGCTEKGVRDICFPLEWTPYETMHRRMQDANVPRPTFPSVGEQLGRSNPTKGASSGNRAGKNYLHSEALAPEASPHQINNCQDTSDNVRGLLSRVVSPQVTTWQSEYLQVWVAQSYMEASDDLLLQYL